VRLWAELALLWMALVLAACSPEAPAIPPASEPTQTPSPTTSKPKPTAAPSRGKQPPRQVRFTAAGDFDTTSNTDDVLRRVKRLNSDLTLTVGDLSYDRPGNEQAWCDYVVSRVGADHPFQLLAGNHESNGRNGHIDAFASCLPNRLPGLVGTYGRRYYIDVPAAQPLVRMIMISPGLTFPEGKAGYRSGSADYKWTAQAIDSARAKSIPWLVVGMHHPCITVGRYSCESGSDVFNLLVSKRVDLILSGHDHSYQRSKQLALGGQCPAVKVDSVDSDCVVDSDARLDRGAGTVAVVVGTGGRRLYDVYDFDSEADYFAAFSGANRDPTYGVVQVRVTAKLLRASFIRASDGSREDSFVITAGSG
jgi:3',5'-cyclic AMP phosphodiesterase CpdA